MPDQNDKKPGCLGAILWSILAVVGTVAGGGFLVYLATRPEGTGVGAGWFLVPVVCGLWAAALVAIGVRLFKARSAAVRVGAPFGCGCFTLVLVAVPIAVVFALRLLLA
ncbi:MAG: hypothetical protein JXB39_07445 [Deltaproteobacteria bacterium]|nr:hypothetical protein [Deltaproteobacteria bacterium]